ncbi:hypothetical protein [Cylindrospermum stagnale]|uniref:hypothetical protein n=1 Tax=Cylindrospermum stagnale TaxID=142864 RepID=UPI0003075954|nr:hypothetical protein [Cylindrospermum stagnale]
MNFSANSSEQQRQFLEEMATKYGFMGDTCTVFLCRFRPKNKNKETVKLAEAIELNREPDFKSSAFGYNLKTIYNYLEKDGCPLGDRGRGKNLYEKAYKWLWEIKFPEWRKTQNIVIPDEQAQKEVVCRFLEQITNDFQHIQLFHTL